MISWKRSYETVSNELELVRRKKQALDSLFNTGRISQSTYDYLNKDISEALKSIEQSFKALMEKMTTRASELEKQTKSLEIFLADLEIHYAAGEIDEEPHGHQADAISLGLEATKQELGTLKELLGRRVLEAAPSISPPISQPTFTALTPPASAIPSAPVAPIEQTIPQLSAEEKKVEAVSEGLTEEKTAEENPPMQEVAMEGVEKPSETVTEGTLMEKIETPAEEIIGGKSLEKVTETIEARENLAQSETPEVTEPPAETTPSSE